MEAALELIRDQQKATWDKFSPGWKKWDEFTMNFIDPMGKAIVAALDVKATDTVIDIATGTGEPGLSIARLANKGKVIGTDLSDGMLSVARERAVSKGITNYETLACDVSELPFADASFDAVSCRFGLMFFPDMKQAMHEMARVLKPGGTFATSVWGTPAANLWVMTTMTPIGEVLELPPPPPGAPGIFRCAAPGMVEDLLREAGFKNIASEEYAADMDFISKEFYWQYINDVIAPVSGAMGKATPEQREQIRSKVFANIERSNPAGGAKLHMAARTISASV